MKLLKEYAEKRKEILDYFGFDDWGNNTIDDFTDCYWGLIEDGVRFSHSKTALEDEDDIFKYYEAVFSFTIPSVYHGEDYIMFAVNDDDGGTYLIIFDKTKELKDLEGDE